MPAANRGQRIAPTVERKGWSSRKLLENVWSRLERRLKADPISAKPAKLTASPINGTRYSKLPSNCVSPPTEVNDRGSCTTLFPVGPVNTPMSARDAGSPGTGTGVPAALEASTTLRDVTKVSSGAIGLIERTL